MIKKSYAMHELANPLWGGQLLFLCFMPFLLLAQQGNQLKRASDSITMSIDFEDVVITAQYAPTHTKNALQSIRVINHQTIQQQGATNLEQLLQQDLNIRVNQDLVLGSSLQLLGVGGENVKIMVDGVPVVGRLNGNIDLSQINLNNVERVEIIEGPMSVTYGTDALGGVINLITKKSQKHPYELQLNGQLESRAESTTSLDAGMRLNNNWLLRINAGYDWFNGFDEDTLRSVAWNPKEQWYANASIRFDFKEDHRIIYSFAYFDEVVKNLGMVRRPQFKPYAFDDFFYTDRINHSLNHEGSVGKHFYWQNTFGYNIFDREVQSYRLDFEDDAQSFLEGDTTIFNTFIGRSILASQFKQSSLNFQLGFDTKLEEGSGQRIEDPESDSSGKSSINDFALFGSIRYQPISSLTLESGLRWAQNSRFEVPLIPSLHLKYVLREDLQLRASYGKGFRSPSLKEMFLSFIDINHFIIGNPNLEAETSDNYQLNFVFDPQYKKHQFSAHLNFFHNEIINQIQLFQYMESDGQIVPAPAGQASTQFAYFNLAKSITKGGNLRLKHQWKTIMLEAGVAAIGFYNPLSESLPEVNPFTYSWELNGRLGYEIPKWGTRFNVFVRQNDRFITYYPEVVDDMEVARQRIQDGFTMLDGSIAHSLLDGRLRLTVGARNLLDIQQVNVVGGGGGAHSGGNGTPIGVGRSFYIRTVLGIFNKGKK